MAHAQRAVLTQQLWEQVQYKQRKNLFQRTGLTKDDIDLFELNEAFAAQSIACIRELGLDESKVNVNGGAIAMGHPLGCSGARLVVTLIHELNRMNLRRGIATLCVGVGQGLATLIEGETTVSASANVEVKIKDCENEDPKKLAAFEKHVAEGGLVEPNDWMPDPHIKSLMLTNGRTSCQQ